VSKPHPLSVPPPRVDRLELIANLRTAVGDEMVVEAYSFLPSGEIELRGALKRAPEDAYRPIRQRIEPLGYTPYLHPDGQRYKLVIVPGVVARAAPQDPVFNVLLFAVTVICVIFAGAFNGETLDIGAGLMFAGSLLGILVTHEAGHYLVGRKRGAKVSLPYFIPLPLPGTFGTMGAVIVQREPFENRRTLLEIAAAGPLAGFIVAVPLLILGFALSSAELNPVIPEGALFFGDSLLTLVVTALRFGRPDALVTLHPIGFGAWIGLLITGINLIPAGQLDGGHIAYALLGPRAKYVSYAMIAVMAGLSLLSTSWLAWVVLLFLFGRNHPSPLNEAVKLRRGDYALVIASVIVLALAFVPRPIY
jgi:membrane-associated protease RseP (regulator of RpoE activity)